MKLDSTHFMYGQIVDEIVNQQDLESKLLLLKYLNPKLSKDGNQWCYLYGDNLQEGVAGFGETPYLAMKDFANSFYNEKIII